MSSQAEPTPAGAVWHPALSVAELPAGAIRAVEVAGRPLVVVCHGDSYVAMDRWCPHQDGDLAQGRILARALKCPLHGYMFSLESGRGLNCRGYSARLHEVQVADGQLLVRLCE